MPSLFKYIPEQFVSSFISEGLVLFRSLSYFRDYEDDQIRGDEFEGTRVFCPSTGLAIHNITQNTDSNFDGCFESSANEDDIFAFCMSKHLRKDLFERFNSDCCIEICKPHRFLTKLKHAILPMASVQEKFLILDSIHYYTPEVSPMADWALPERIALSKPAEFSWQDEVRAAFAVNGAFKPENVRIRIIPRGERRYPRAFTHPDMPIRIGNLSSLCKIRRSTECA